MKKLFHKLSQSSLSGFGSALLISAALGVALITVGVTALYVAKYAKLTPEMKTLQCLLGLRPDCPDEMAKLRDLQEQMARLKSAEDQVDKITLFSVFTDPGSGLKVTVGTIYHKLSEPDRAPPYYCYIDLAMAGGVSRNLYIRSAGASDFLTLDDATLRASGIGGETLDYARSVCQPLLIGDGQ